MMAARSLTVTVLKFTVKGRESVTEVMALAPLLTCFEEYEFNKVRFIYKALPLQFIISLYKSTR